MPTKYYLVRIGRCLYQVQRNNEHDAMRRALDIHHFYHDNDYSLPRIETRLK
jgi:hypothetical protein